MSILERARQAMEMIANARGTLTQIASAVRDGTEAISTSDKEELQAILEREKAESRAAHDDLAAAIAEARR